MGATVAGQYQVTFGGGIGAGLVIGLGDAEVCFVEPSPLDLDLPRLDMDLMVEEDRPFHACQRGDDACTFYLISNNDPDCSVSLDLTAMNTQIAGRIGGDAPNLFTVSSPVPGADNFPISIGDEPLPIGDPMDPDDPVNAPATGQIVLQPLEQIFIKVNTGIHGMCANGSCSEQLLKVTGVFQKEGGLDEPALACAQTAIYVDNNASAKTPLCTILDEFKAAPHNQCAVGLAVVLDIFLNFNADPPSSMPSFPLPAVEASSSAAAAIPMSRLLPSVTSFA